MIGRGCAPRSQKEYVGSVVAITVSFFILERSSESLPNMPASDPTNVGRGAARYRLSSLILDNQHFAPAHNLQERASLSFQKKTIRISLFHLRFFGTFDEWEFSAPTKIILVFAIL